MRSMNVSDRIGGTATAFRLISSPNTFDIVDVPLWFRNLAESVTLRGDGSPLDTVALCVCDYHSKGLGLHFL